MRFPALGEFVQYLESIGEVKRISAKVDPYLEVTEIATRALRENKPALLFENVKGSKYPLAMNIYASERRIELAIGRHPQQIGEELISFAEQMMPPKPQHFGKIVQSSENYLKGKRGVFHRESHSKSSRRQIFVNFLFKLAGLAMAADLLRKVRCSRTILSMGSAMSVCTGCMCMTMQQPVCTGKFKKAADFIIIVQNSWEKEPKLPLLLERIPHCCLHPSPPCPKDLMK